MKSIIILSLWLMVFCACKKSTTNEPQAPVDHRLGGKIMLPAGSSINPESLSVLSAYEVAKGADGGYKMDSASFENYSTQVVLDADGEALMMRYNYPGDESRDINAQSTATALLMNTPAVQSLTEQGKLALVRKMAALPEFIVLVTEISKNLMSGRALLDSTNLPLMNAFAELELTASKEAREGVFAKPILIHKAGNNVSFTNYGVAVYYWVGIYKDGNKVTSFPIEAAKLISSSAKDYIMDAVDIVGDLPSVSYTLIGDGEYQIHLRSGAWLDNTQESKSALTQNLLFGALDLMSTVVKSDCLGAVADVIKGHLEAAANTYVISETTPNDIQELLIQILTATYNTYDFTKCAKNEVAASSLKKLVKIFVGYLEFVEKIANMMNLTISAIHFAAAEPALDTCFTVTRGIATTCVQDNSFAIGSFLGYCIWSSYEMPGADVKVGMDLHITSIDANNNIEGTLRIDIHTSRVYGSVNGSSITFGWDPQRDAPFSFTGRFSADKKTIDGHGGAGNYYAPRNANGPFKLERFP